MQEKNYALLEILQGEQKLSEEPEKNIGKDHIGERKNLVDVQTGILTADQKEELHTENGEQKENGRERQKRSRNKIRKQKEKRPKRNNRRERYRC